VTSIIITPKIEVCHNFIDHHGTLCTSRSVVIAPIRVTVNEEENKFYMIYACSLAEKCLFTNCLYSRIKHPELQNNDMAVMSIVT